MNRRILSTGLALHLFSIDDGLMDNRLIALAALVLTGCAATTAVPKDAAAAPAMVTGTVTYRERIALPPTAVITGQLVDVSRADAPAVVIGEQVIHSSGQLRFINDQHYAVVTRGAPVPRVMGV